MSENLDARALGLDDVVAYIDVDRRGGEDSGQDGRPHSHAYPRNYPHGGEERIERERQRWQLPLEEEGWRRAWGCFHEGQLVGSLYLAGGSHPSELHRAHLGMGFLPAFRGKGGGTRLLEVAIEWARGQETLAWIDLGVFGDNPRAEALYRRFGFVERGRTPDRFRVDGVIVDNISLSLFVER